MTGRLYGIGLGPGAADLVTVRAAELLKTVDAVCLPRSGAKQGSVALKIAGAYFKKNAEVIEIDTPMTRDRSVLEASWRQGAERMVEKLRGGSDIAFITIGDSMLFSTYSYLMKQVMKLAPEVQIESIPGITSFSASAAHLNIPLAEGEERLLIVPALNDPKELTDIFAAAQNVVLMKVAGQFDGIVAMLTQLNLLDKAVYISKLGYEDQLVTRDFNCLLGKKTDYLSLILVKQGGL